MRVPIKHLSIRVPWHDSVWDGTVCGSPTANSSCLILKNVGEKRDDAAETSRAGMRWDELEQRQRPACATERGGFMSPFPIVEMKTHPYADSSPKSHGHLKPTVLYHPPYSAAAIPYFWMLRENSPIVADEFGLPYDDAQEPEIGDWAKAWVQHGSNHEALLDGFFRHIEPQDSLCFFYAKQTPLTDDPRRVIVGIGRVKSLAPLKAYDATDGGEFHSMIWDRPVEHSIRTNCVDGFLLPYHQALAFAQNHPGYDVSQLALFAPDGKQREFSYVSDLVTDDTAITVLQDALRIIHIARQDLEGPWDQIESWIDAELARLWEMRGDYPGLGSMLCAFGVHAGNLVGWELQNRIPADIALSEFLDQFFGNPKHYLPQSLSHCLEPTLCRTWQSLPAERRRGIALLAHFSLTTEQARLALEAGSDILSDPYNLVTSTGKSDDPITCETVDHALFKSATVNQQVSTRLHESITGPLDERRIKAYTWSVLERAAVEGHSLLPQTELIQRLRSRGCVPPLEVRAEILTAIHNDWSKSIEVVSVSPDPCGYQLTRLARVREVICDVVKARTGERSKAHAVPQNWPTDDVLETRTITPEQRAALLTIYRSRFSTLLGPAGSGKTTILSVLCQEEAIVRGGVLAIAPTGKARVRLQHALHGMPAQTLAQFLLEHDRYDPNGGEYHLSSKPRFDGAETVIVDEASMLTEEMLAALLECTPRAKRIILVGDPNQLPPIGTGRPFYDIASYLRDSATGYAELTARHRQKGEDRDDLRLADTFVANAPADDDFAAILQRHTKHLSYHNWTTDAELEHLLLQVLTQELELADDSDQLGFDRSLGGNDRGFFDIYNSHVDRWQMLSPNRLKAYGNIRLNRLIHERFRQDKLRFALKPSYQRRTLGPIGSDRIVYGDKVIANQNGKRKAYPERKGYVANGETGIVCGPFASKPGQRLRSGINVAFTSQPGCNYTFWKSEFSDNANSLPPLELAYSLTVHKAQGSEYDLVVLVLPEPCNLLGRELLYTAFTRQTRRLVILHQGSAADLRRYQSDHYSELARRLTNLFIAPSIRLIDDVPYEERLIHVSRRGEPMRSKSEVIIADNLCARNVDYAYEKPLIVDGVTRWPDFTIEKADTGEVFYWEHCGMLRNPTYTRRWEEKLRWYRANGILPPEDGEGPNGTLIITKDDQNGGISSKELSALIDALFA